LDSSNNVLVTGNALTIKYELDGNQLWTAPYPGESLAVDSKGNATVTGISSNFGTVQLSPNGSNLWVATYPSSSGPGFGQQVIIVPDGSIYVAGFSTFICQEDMCYSEMVVAKYDGNGDQLWTIVFMYGDVDSTQVVGIAADDESNLYIAANFQPIGPVYGLFKYASNGELLWETAPYVNFQSASKGLCLDSSDSVEMTGKAGYNSPAFSYGTFKVDSSGSFVWTNDYPQNPSESSVASAIAVDLSNNSYVTGFSPGSNSRNDIVTIKYDPNGNQMWLQRYNGPGNGNGAGNAIDVDKNGNVYVAGYDTTVAGGTEMVLIKYSPVLIQRQPNGTVLLQTEGSPGESFEIQASEDLLNWLDLGSVLADTNGLMQFDDTNAPNYPARFYLTSPQ
jgi:hypothetical protein